MSWGRLGTADEPKSVLGSELAWAVFLTNNNILFNINAGIEAVHQAGGLVKVAYGGALYSMSFSVTDQ